jgi:GAF domain-containing protein
MHDRSDLAAVLAETARTINAPRSIEETLGAIVHAARASVPGFDEVGISLVHKDGTIETMAATGQLVWDLDALQYDLAEGPCVDAMIEDPVLVLERAAADPRWPRYLPKAVAAGLRAQMGVRLYAEDGTLGGLNLYSTRSDTIGEDAVHTAEIFATHAALALGRARRESQLAEALESRTIIGTAVGLLMARYQIDRNRAFQFLVRASSTSNIKVRDIADEIVSDVESGFANP